MLKQLKPKDIKKIVIFRTDRIGEVLLSTVCVDALKEYLPGVSVDFVVSDYSKDIALAKNNIDNVFAFNTLKNISFADFFRLVLYLNHGGFDASIILNPHKILHLACFLAGIPIRIGYSRKWKFLLTHTIKDKKSEAKKHEIEYNLDILKILDIYADVRAPSLDAPKEDLDYIDKVINNSGLDSKKLTVAIHIGSSNPSKVWPLENFSSLAEGIRKKIDCNIVFIGDDKDKDEAAKILLADKSLAANLCGAFSVKQLIAFLKKTDIFIGCDSGPMHIAASVGAKVIALFGNASNPLRWHPWGKGHLVLQNDDINKITPTEILAQLKS